MAFDHIRIPLTVDRDDWLVSSTAFRCYKSLAGFYNHVSFACYPSIEQIAYRSGRVSIRTTQDALRELERAFFVFRETIEDLKAAGFFESLDFRIPWTPMYLLPDLMLLDPKMSAEKLKLLSYLFGRCEKLHHLVHRAAPPGAKSGPKGRCEKLHLNHLFEQYKEQERLFLERAERPGRTVTLMVQENHPKEDRASPESIAELLKPLKEKLSRKHFSVDNPSVSRGGSLRDRRS